MSSESRTEIMRGLWNERKKSAQAKLRSATSATQDHAHAFGFKSMSAIAMGLGLANLWKASACGAHSKPQDRWKDTAAAVTVLVAGGTFVIGRERFDIHERIPTSYIIYLLLFAAVLMLASFNIQVQHKEDEDHEHDDDLVDKSIYIGSIGSIVAAVLTLPFAVMNFREELEGNRDAQVFSDDAQEPEGVFETLKSYVR